MLPYIILLLLFVEPAYQSCPHWEYQGKNPGCFRLLRNVKFEGNQADAKKACELDHGSLAVIDDQEQEDWLLDKFVKDPNEQYKWSSTSSSNLSLIWIGLERYNGNSEEWDWIDDRTDSWHRNWGHDEPNNGGNNEEIVESCVVLSVDKSGRNNGWNDMACNETQYDNKVLFAFCRYYF